MANWHQQQNPVKLYHETKWTLVHDPLGGMTSVERFTTAKEAEDSRVRRELAGASHLYILPPGIRKGD